MGLKNLSPRYNKVGKADDIVKTPENSSSVLGTLVSQDEALEYLAKVLVDAYFEQRKYAETR